MTDLREGRTPRAAAPAAAPALRRRRAGPGGRCPAASRTVSGAAGAARSGKPLRAPGRRLRGPERTGRCSDRAGFVQREKLRRGRRSVTQAAGLHVGADGLVPPPSRPLPGGSCSPTSGAGGASPAAPSREGCVFSGSGELPDLCQMQCW